MMSRTSVAVLLLLASAGVGRAQLPAITYRGVVNAASFMPQGLPGGGIAQGSIFSIFGTGLGPSSPAAASAFPLASSISGVSIKVFQGNTSLDSIPLYVSATQISAIMPSNAPLGMVSVQVSYNNAKSNPAPVRVVGNSFGIFTANTSGFGPGIIQNFVSSSSQPVNSAQLTAQPGQMVTLWGTGLGPAGGPDNVAPTVGNLPTPVEVSVGNRVATVQYRGRSPCCAGVDQVNFQIPSDAPQGCWVPVYVRTAGATVSNTVTMAIQSSGGACRESANSVANPLVSGARAGSLIFVRASVKQDIGTSQPIDVTTDYFNAVFAAQPAGSFNFVPLISMTPAGTCTAYGVAGNLLQSGGGLGIGAARQYIDGGTGFAVTGPKGTQNLTAPAPAVISMNLGSSIPGLLSSTLFLDPGAYTVSGVGGNDVGSFQAPFNFAPGLTWTNRDQTSLVDRTQGLTINWSGAATGQTVFAFGGNFDRPTNSSSAFLCVAQPGAASLTIPPVVLANIPATRARLTQSLGAVYLAQWPIANPGRFSAPGSYNGFVFGASLVGKTVMFK